MKYYALLIDLKPYLKSIRTIKDHLSIDLIFPKTWVIPKKYTTIDSVSIVKNSDEFISFVSKFEEENVNELENTINELIQFNIDKEEKENLFRNKVKELKTIFDSENIDELRGLKFEFDEIKNMLNNREDESEDSEGVRELQDSESHQ